MGKKVGIIPWPLSKRRGGGGGGGLLSNCRYPRTTSFADGRGGDGEFQRAATLEDIDRFLCENFSSLYDGSVGDEHTRELVDEECCYGSAGGSAKVVSAGDVDGDHTRGSRASEIVLASSSSRRFLVSTAGKPSAITTTADGVDVAGTRVATTLTEPPSAYDYSSITTSRSATTASSAESASSSSPDCQRDSTASIPDDGVAVVTFSKDPEDDFFRSMEEMLDAHLCQQRFEQEQQHLKPRYPALVDWDFMQDLLLCYLHLNDPRVHSHILQAFADLVAELKTRKDVVLSEEAVQRDGGGVGGERVHEKRSDLSELEDNTSCCDCCCHDRSDSDEGKGLPTAYDDAAAAVVLESSRY